MGIVEGETRLDLSYYEDSTAEVDLNLIMTGSGEVVEVNGSDALGHQKVIEAAFDRGEIEAAGAREPLAEIELELRQGTPRALYDLALRLQEVAPTQIETRVKGVAVLIERLVSQSVH